MAKDEKAVVKVDENAVPAFIDKGDRRGTEALTAENIQIPRLLLLQGLSPQAMEGKGKLGNFYHNVLEEDLGQEMTVVPVLINYNFILWPPRGSDGSGTGTFLARSDDAIHWLPPNKSFRVTLKNGKEVVWTTRRTVKESGLDLFGSSDPDDINSVPAATKSQRIFCVCPDRPELGTFIIMLQNTSLKAGRKFNTKLAFGDYAIFARYVKLKSFLDSNNKGQKYYNWDFAFGPYVQNEEEYKKYAELHERYSNMQVRVIGEDAEDGTDGAAATATVQGKAEETTDY